MVLNNVLRICDMTWLPFKLALAGSLSSYTSFIIVPCACCFLDSLVGSDDQTHTPVLFGFCFALQFHIPDEAILHCKFAFGHLDGPVLIVECFLLSTEVIVYPPRFRYLNHGVLIYPVPILVLFSFFFDKALRRHFFFLSNSIAANKIIH